MVDIVLNGMRLRVEEGTTVLEVARSVGVEIPTLCYHKALKPYGGCRLCVVEISGLNIRKMIRSSCNLEVSEGLVIKTSSLRLDVMRKKLLALYLSLAPKPRYFLVEMAGRYGVTESGSKEDGIDFCTRCTLCIRVCREKIGAAALLLAKTVSPAQSVTRSIRLFSEACMGGGTCVSICPSGALSLKDDGSQRTLLLWGRPVAAFKLITCESCGRPYVTQKYFNRLHLQLSHEDGKDVKKVCPECARRYYAVALTGRFVCGER
ncbi:MAG: 2Fe-2S iron-sulfur cluster-binding protein [Dissulfurispiraceae bacterium]